MDEAHGAPDANEAPAACKTDIVETALAALRRCFPEVPSTLATRFVDLLHRGQEVDRVLHLLDKPYGRNLIVAVDGDYAVSCARLLPGCSTSLHRHRLRREFFVVRCGEMVFTDCNVERRLPTGTTATSTPGCAHQLANVGTVDCEFVEVFSPPLLNDKYRLSDPYARATGAVTMLD